MKKILLILTFIASLSVCHAQTVVATDDIKPFIGRWSGVLRVGQTELTMVLNLSPGGEGKIVCTLDSPDQGVKGIEATAAVKNFIQIEVAVAAIGAIYSGTLMNGSILGTFTQAGHEFPLTLTKAIVKLNRPQTPVAPFPYSTREVTFCNEKAGATLAGTLVIPENAGPLTPVVLMVTGSGQENRDEEIFEHKPFWVIADYLARHGIATLRYDDRDFGESKGGDVKNATTLDFFEDAKAGIEFLRNFKFVENPNSKIGVLGHSEGGSIAFMLGAEKLVDFVISLAGPGVQGDQLLTAQANRVLEFSGADMRYTVQEYRELVMKQGVKWLNWFIDYNPVSHIRACSCPVFAANGGKDIQVIASQNLISIKENLPDNPQNLVKEYPELNHLFQHCKSGAVTEYRSIEETISPELLNDLATWICSLKL